MKISEYLENNFSVIPVDKESKQPLIKWKQYQTKAMTPDEALIAFKNAKSVAVCTGYDGLEVLDFDNHFGDAQDILDNYMDMLRNTNDTLAEKLIIIRTQRGGFHLPYKSKNVQGNQKLAAREHDGKKDAIIETRGTGGYVLAPPTKGYEGSYANIPRITEEERDTLIALARSFHAIDDNPVVAHSRAGDDYNHRSNIIDIIRPHGWFIVATLANNVIHFGRPGKQKGVSATYNVIPGKLYVFSSNAYPFEAGKTYDHFAAYTFLNHAGNFKEAAKHLYETGYGTAPEPQQTNGKQPEKQAPKQEKINHVTMVQEYLEKHYDLRYNVIRGYNEYKLKAESTWKILNDRNVGEVWRFFNERGIKIPKSIIDNIFNSEYTSEYDAMKIYFDSLPEWDGKDHIEEFANQFTVHPEQKNLWELALQRWLIAAYGTALGYCTNHQCIVLVGSQGIGKSTMISKLYPTELKEYCNIIHLNTDDKDSKIAVAENLILNLDELETSTKDEIGLLKSLLTATSIHVRRAYARLAQQLQRRASFIGSVNQMEFLSDNTGSRRFIGIDILSINMNYNPNINQLWSQAKYGFHNGVKYWFDNEEINILNQNNERYNMYSAEEEMLMKLFKPYKTDNLSNEELFKKQNNGIIELLTNTEIYDIIQKQTAVRISQKKLGQILHKHGYEQRIITNNSKTKKLFVLSKNANYEQDNERVF